ncbi:acyl carrier protein [Crocinitomicaceae bacterium CZZ-1]|uniref:Acyl carrier protein n=1 Tax=Taishania pollutisoli TaxID=2766479 RepID=A0A8J6TTP9_9FLAO|nr:phosphopantetheine-binding protein [Taishania pollutisoli]MBC9813432.1 acyl carrier protein [Taishania pollutisoli]MBX2950681.1 acyl carrier protein [Crocinitomicaceae bacterium]NGF76528.1 acyl carrier protein [Fluviicola sp. SGL-29]
MSELKENLKAQIIEQLSLEDLTPADIKDDAPLFGDEGLGLDSIDALEFIVLLESNYGIKIADPSKGREIFHSVNSLAAFIESNQ